MAPEYARLGRFSVKSDVFSFGVLVLEIICGQRVSNFQKGGKMENLLSYVCITIIFHFMIVTEGLLSGHRFEPLWLVKWSSCEKINSIPNLLFCLFKSLQAWENWKEGKAMNLVDPKMSHSASRHEIVRCIHIALLSVQEKVADRPTMSSVILMLSSFSLALRSPSRPAYFLMESN